MPEITQEDLDLFEKYKQLGSIDELGGDKEDVIFTATANAMGYKKTVFARLFKTLPAEYSLSVPKEESGEYKMKTPEGEIELGKFVDEEWAEFLPSLKTEAVNTGVKSVTHVRQTAQARDTGKRDVGKRVANKYIDTTYGWALKNAAVTN